MSLPTLSGVARLTQDPELRFTPSGMAIATVQLAFNARKKNAAGEWEDGDTFFVKGTAFKDVAEHIAESLTRGTEVVVTGRLKTDSWESRSGDKRSAPALLLDSIGPSLRWATAKVAKATRASGNTQAGSDPWTSDPVPAQQSADDDEPPF